MHRVKLIMGFLMLLVYSLILVHDFIPHHTHLGTEYVNFSNFDHIHSNSDCDHEHECQFPFHQHNINEAGLYSSSTTLVVNVPFEFESMLQKINMMDDNPLDIINSYTKIQALDYGEPEITSTSLRGPPNA